MKNNKPKKPLPTPFKTLLDKAINTDKTRK